MDQTLSKRAKILISEQIDIVAIFYFEQVFVFCRVINETVLEWFLLIICKKNTLYLQTFLVDTFPYCFWFRREGRKHELSIFICLRYNSFVDSFPYKCMPLGLWSMDFCSYFFTLTLESDCLELCFWTVAFKTILTQ